MCVHFFAVGALPDSSAFTSDCSKLIVAIEGEPTVVEGLPVDPEGGATILDFGTNPDSGNVLITFLDFTQFNNMYWMFF